ncbi:HlyD family efflux transporter periplasmic adaptor subunit [Pseudoalteromonas luteoviolacea]|uniref:efflux RND transporter periplasmic adaptor subunit n=1 Tax=Pseudoalteromonas luteoviolacea TaxID=43657 RepID=UPI001F478921|nr:HlyD family efflux transporter periplasmic adaptor subunit [Pseudoalteromonas luteoviolacea]MCF6441624.1 HlyD family efflux transporter periplasmic adaptor subunit [Pseudoalteromonas luteoviolacea]
MDIRVPKKTSFPLRHKWAVGLLAGAVIITALWASLSDKKTYLERHSLMIDTVKHGALSITVDAFGTLVSAEQKIITATSPGVVIDIKHKPGDVVAPGTVIARLENADLELDYKRAQQQLAEVQAELHQLDLRQQRELLVERSAISQLEGQLATLSFRFQAQKGLAEQGIISQLSFLETQAQLRSVTGQIDHAKARLSQLQALHQSTLQLMQKRVALSQQEQASLASKVTMLSITAPNDGVIESMSLDLGTRIAMGDHIATLGDQAGLIAQLQVSQSQAGSVQVGQPVDVFAGEAVLRGEVLRIDPVVSQHSVKVEVRLPEYEYLDLRPKQSITASIVIDTIENTHYIRTPVMELSTQSIDMYKVLETGHTELVEVQFGQRSERHVEVKSGLQAGQAVVISDLDALAKARQVVVIQ